MSSTNKSSANYSKWTKVVRPAILKRDQYKCRVCGIAQHSLVYINSLGNYTLCDDFVYSWAIKNNKSPFKVWLKVACLDGSDYSEDPDNLITLCAHHYNYVGNDIFKAMRAKLAEQTTSLEMAPAFHLDRWREEVIRPFAKALKQITGVKITNLESSQLINNLIKSIENVKN